MAKMSLDELKNSLVMEGYTPRTDEQLQTEAQNRFTSTYNQKKQIAQQNYDTSDHAYQQQMAQLADTLSNSQNQLIKNTNDSIASANRYQITRGMQRSSYGAANAASIMNKGNEGLAGLMKQYATDANGIQNNRTLLAQQLADTLAQYDIDYMNDVQGYIDQQKQLDYDRKVAADQYANQLQTQLFEYSQKYGSSGGGGGGYRSGGGASTAADTSSGNNSSLWSSIGGATSGPLTKMANSVSSTVKKQATASAQKKAVAQRAQGRSTSTSKK